MLLLLGLSLLLIMLVVLVPLRILKWILIRILVLILLLLMMLVMLCWTRGVTRRRTRQHFYFSVDIPNLEGARVRPAVVLHIVATHPDWLGAS